MTLIEIVSAYLTANGYDGLYNSMSECACKVDDLAPCDQPGMDCTPGYLTPCPEDCGDHDWHIQEKKVKVGRDGDGQCSEHGKKSLAECGPGLSNR